MSRKSEILLLAGCLFFMTVFIFDNINERALWLDEASVAIAVSTPFSNLTGKAIIDGHPLFYIYALKTWSLAFGNSETALRSFSAFWAILLILLLYAAAKYIFENKKVGILAVAVASTNYFLIWFSQQVKSYTLAAFLGLSSFFLFMMLKRRPAIWKNILYVISSVIGIFTHPWILFIFLSQIIDAFVTRKKIGNYKNILLSQLLITMLSLPAILIYWHQKTLGLNVWLETPTPLTLIQSFKYLTFGSTIIYLIIGLIAFVIYMEGRKKEKKKVPDQEIIGTINIWTYFLLPIFIAYSISQISSVYYPGRYEMTILPALILITAGFLTKINNKFIVSVFIGAMLIFTSRQVAAQHNMVENFTTDDRKTAAEILNRADKNDFIITTDLSWATFYYYLNKFNEEESKSFKLISFPREIEAHPGWKNDFKMKIEKDNYKTELQNLIAEISTDKNGVNKIWVVYKNTSPINDLLFENFLTNFRLISIEEQPQTRGNSWFDSILIFENRK